MHAGDFWDEPAPWHVSLRASRWASLSITATIWLDTLSFFLSLTAVLIWWRSRVFSFAFRSRCFAAIARQAWLGKKLGLFLQSFVARAQVPGTKVYSYYVLADLESASRALEMQRLHMDETPYIYTMHLNFWTPQVWDDKCSSSYAGDFLMSVGSNEQDPSSRQLLVPPYFECYKEDKIPLRAAKMFTLHSPHIFGRPLDYT